MKDIGRQRVTNYVARRWAHLSTGACQYRVERDKHDQLTSSVKVEVKEEHEEEEEEDVTPRNKRKGKMDRVRPKKERKSTLEEKFGVEMVAEVVRRVEEGETSRVEEGEGSREEEEGSRVEEEVEREEEKLAPGGEEAPIHISISSGFHLEETEGARRRERQGDRGETFRQLRRANTIIEAVRLHTVFDDPTKLYKMIQEQEVAEGYQAKMDKKSLMRLLSRLGREGQVKNIRVVFQHLAKTKTLHFVCNPEVSEDNTIIQSAIEQAKMKFNIPPRAAAMAREGGEFASASVSASLAAMAALEVEARAGPGRPAAQRFGRRYGLQPKFVKMRELHQVLRPET